MNPVKRVALIGGVVAVLALLTIVTTYIARNSVSQIPAYYPAPLFQAYNQDSVMVSTADLFKGKITVANFFFTHCPSICPLTTEKILELGKFYEKDVDKVQFVSITVDPMRDVPSVLKAYREAKQGSNSWTMLYQPNIDSLKRISEVGFKLPAGVLPGEHSGKFVLIDEKGIIRGYYGYSEEASIRTLKSHIRELALAAK